MLLCWCYDGLDADKEIQWQLSKLARAVSILLQNAYRVLAQAQLTEGADIH